MTAKPGVVERARLALRVFSGGLPSHPWNVPQHKAAPFIWPAWREGKPEWQIVDFQSYVAEGFNLNTLIYQAIMYKARAMNASPMRAYGGDPDQPELLKPDHPLAQLAARPNRHQSGVEFCQLNTVYLNIAGNVYIHLDRPQRGGIPVAMRSLRPDRVFIVPEKGGVKGYLYVPEGKSSSIDWSRADVVPILPEDLMHIKLPNPGDPLEGFGYGLSPISPLAQSGDVDNSITHFLKLFFQHGAMPSTVLSFEAFLDETEIARIKERWHDIYGGYQNWAEVGVIAQGGKIQKLGMTFEEMGFGSIDERNEARITGPFGVPVILLNTRVGSVSNTYANYEIARRAFWQDTFVPEIGLYDAAYSYYLRSDDGGFIQHDMSRVPALQEDKPKLVEAAYKLWSMGTPLNMACRALGLDVPEVPGGDVGYLPISVVPVTGSAPKPKPTMSGAPEAEAQAQGKSQAPHEAVKGWSVEQKVALWHKVDRVATSWEKRFASAASDQFETDKRAILGIIGDARVKALERKATIAWDSLNTDVKAYLEAEGGDAWRTKFVPLIQGVVTDQGKHWATTLGLEFDARNLFAEDWFNEYMLEFATPINATTLDSIGTMLQQAQAEGWSVPTMQKHLGTMFEQWSKGDLSKEDFDWYSERMPTYRTEAIARTETMRASNAGSNALFGDWGVKQNEWLATQDDRTRDSHRAADGQVVQIGKPFNVGGAQMLYPGDSSMGAGPEEIVDCRCVPGNTLINPTVVQAAYRRWYTGSLIQITTARGYQFTATPNHPILADSGWVAIGCLCEGDYILDCPVGQNVPRTNPDVNHMPTPISQLFDALALSKGLRSTHRISGSSMQFHGDGRGGNVDVVVMDDHLARKCHSAFGQPIREFGFAPAERKVGLTSRHSPGVNISHSQSLGFRSIAGRDACSNEPGADHVAVCSEGKSQSLLGFTAEITASNCIRRDWQPGSPFSRTLPAGDGIALLNATEEAETCEQFFQPTVARMVALGQTFDSFPSNVITDRVIEVRVISFAGHVYNLQTLVGWYAANGIISHNCTVLPVMEGT